MVGKTNCKVQDLEVLDKWKNLHSHSIAKKEVSLLKKEIMKT